MVDYVLLTTSLISAIVAYLAGVIFVTAYRRERKSSRLLWGLAFILYALGHTIVVITTSMEIGPTNPIYITTTWLYINLSGAGTTGLVLFATMTFVVKKAMVREIVTAIFVALYVIGSAAFGFFLPGDTPLAVFNPSTHTQLLNMSYWVIELLIPVSFFIGLVFLRHFTTSGSRWAVLIGLSFLVYALVLFIWPIQDLKWLFYIIRTVSVGLLGLGGYLLAKE
ncbi:MAG: hypothetical protein HXY34_01535 [Candidatus Thorarchaeota archaeon]|nr:hypothetical protein [Candidatus Thorarchaeota archaeon]